MVGRAVVRRPARPAQPYRRGYYSRNAAASVIQAAWRNRRAIAQGAQRVGQYVANRYKRYRSGDVKPAGVGGASSVNYVSRVHQMGGAGRVVRKKMKKLPKGAATFASYYKAGVVRKIETSGVITNAGTLYIGHGCPHQQMTYQMSSAFVKVLYRRAGLAVVSMREKVQGEGNTVAGAPGVIGFTYRRQDGDITQQTFGNIAAQATFDDVAAQLYALITALTTQDIIPVSVWIQGLTAGGLGTSDNFKTVSLDLTRCTLEFAFTSALKVQNRTLAVSATTTDNELVTDVANNPLDGKLYKGYGNGPLIRVTDFAAVNNSYTLCNNSTGVITFDFNSLPVNARADFVRPPRRSAFMRATGEKSVSINPGAFAMSMFNWHKKISCATFLRMIVQLNSVALNQGVIPLGKFELMGLERFCAAGTTNPAIGYELSSTQRCQLHFTMPTTNAHTIVL